MINVSKAITFIRIIRLSIIFIIYSSSLKVRAYLPLLSIFIYYYLSLQRDISMPRRRFGDVISGNRQPQEELSYNMRIAIVAAHASKISSAKIAS